MKTIHHIITFACNKSCSYCINERLLDGNRGIEKDLKAIEDMYQVLSDKYDSITITGGEPTIYFQFSEISRLARKYFRETALITANTKIFNSGKHQSGGSFKEIIDNCYDSVMFSLHEPYKEEFFNIYNDERLHAPESWFFSKIKSNLYTPVYLSMISSFFHKYIKKMYLTTPANTAKDLFSSMRANGFSGVTIREEYPEGERVNFLVETYANFSVRVERSKDCTNHDFLYPNLSIVNK